MRLAPKPKLYSMAEAWYMTLMEKVKEMKYFEEDYPVFELEELLKHNQNSIQEH